MRGPESINLDDEEDNDEDDEDVASKLFHGKCLSIRYEGSKCVDIELKTSHEKDILIESLCSFIEIDSTLCDDNDLKEAAKSRTSNFTSAIFRFMYNKKMENFIFACIIISVVSMAISTPDVDESSTKGVVLGVLEWVVSIIFTIEAILRIVALEGMYPYLLNSWNVLDFVIVVVGWATEIPPC